MFFSANLVFLLSEISLLFPQIAGKQASFHGLTEYYQGAVAHENKAIGEEISRLEVSSIFEFMRSFLHLFLAVSVIFFVILMLLNILRKLWSC